MKYLVLLSAADGSPVALVNTADEVWGHRLALFDCEEDAEGAGWRNPLGKAYGFKVIEWEME